MKKRQDDGKSAPVRQPYARRVQPVEQIIERARAAAPAGHSSEPAAQDAHLMRKLRELEQRGGG